MVLYVFITLIMLYLFFAALEIGRIYLFKLTRLERLIDITGDGITRLVKKSFARRTPKEKSCESCADESIADKEASS